MPESTRVDFFTSDLLVDGHPAGALSDHAALLAERALDGARPPRCDVVGLAHFSVSSHQPAPPPDHPKGTIDGWLGGGAGRTHGSTQGENGLEAYIPCVVKT